MIFLAIPVICALLFALLHIGFSLCRLERLFTLWDGAMLAWCVVYAMFALWFAGVSGVVTSEPGGPQIEITLVPVTMFIMVPSLITGLLAAAAWRAFRFLPALLIAGIASVAISLWLDMLGMMFVAPIVWIAFYYFACQRRIRALNRSIADVICPACSYPLDGLDPMYPCPECGRARSEKHAREGRARS